MDDDLQMIPIDDLHFVRRTDTLPAELVDRITLIHHVFRNFLHATLDETIDNFKHDKNPEEEVRIWEHMASVILALQYQCDWPQDKVAAAVRVVLGLSMGMIQDNTLDKASTDQIIALWNDRNPR